LALMSPSECLTLGAGRRAPHCCLEHASPAFVVCPVGSPGSRLFPSAAHLVSWAKFAPQARQSAGKNKQATTGKGNPWLAGTLGEIVATASRTNTQGRVMIADCLRS